MVFQVKKKCFFVENLRRKYELKKLLVNVQNFFFFPLKFIREG